MSWFEKLMPSRIRTEGKSKRTVPEGLWTKCPACDAVLYRTELERNQDVCPKCDSHMRISARRRLDLFLDSEPREEIGAEVQPTDSSRFADTWEYDGTTWTQLFPTASPPARRPARRAAG